MAPAAVEGSVNILPGVQGAAGKAISQTNRDIVAHRRALRLGQDPATAVGVDNKSAAERLREEMRLGGPPIPLATTDGPISAKAVVKRKLAALEEENGDSEFSSPPTPIPKGNDGGTQDVEDTVRFNTQTIITYGRLWEPGYKERYYEQKFHVDYNTAIEFRKT